MMQVINRKLYNTETADQLAQYAPNWDKSDFHYLIETLYKTEDGMYFLHGEGGAGTEYGTKCNGARTGSQEIIPLTDDEALDWCEERKIDGEIVVAEFEHLIET